MGSVPKVLYVGWASEAPEGTERHIGAPTAPSNYKDPDKIAKYIEQERAARAAGVAHTPGPAALTRVVMLDGDGDVWLSFERNSLPGPAVNLYAALREAAPTWWSRRSVWTAEALPQVAGEPVFVGFDVGEFFNIFALAGARIGLSVPCGFLRRDDPSWVDPYRLALSTEHRKVVGLPGLCALLGIVWVTGPDPARIAAEMARQLSNKLQIEFK